MSNIKGKTVLMDRANYRYDHSLHGLLGAPEGYIGGEKPALLSELFKEGAAGFRFDEIGHAALNVQKALCQTDDNGDLKKDEAGKPILRESVTTARGEVLSLKTSKLGL